MKHYATIALVMIGLSTVAEADPAPRAAVREDYSNLCNSLERSGASNEKHTNLRAEKIAKYLRDHIKTQEVKDFIRKLGDGSLAPDEVGPALKKAASAAGYKGKCPIAEKQ